MTRLAVAALALAGAAALLLAWPLDVELTARGGARAPALHLRTLCVTADARHVVDPTHGVCPRGARLKVLVSGEGTRYVAVLIVEGERVTRLDESLPRLPNEMALLPGTYEAGAGALRVVALALATPVLDGSDPLYVWSKTAAPGSYAGVLGRADAVVQELTLGEAP